jgi:sarcosine oxidase subunit gamma
MRSTGTDPLIAGWVTGLSILNRRALGLDLPLQSCTTATHDRLRLVWVGPDDWFAIGPSGPAAVMAGRLRADLSDKRCAVTDVSSGYTVLRLQGPSARDVLAQGCPLDLHRRVFEPGRSAGSHFFKASVWLWQVDEVPTFELLVRRSFMAYGWLMLERASADVGMIVRHPEQTLAATG